MIQRLDAAAKPPDPVEIEVNGVGVYYPFGGEMMAERVRVTGEFYELPLLKHMRALGLGGTYIDVGAHCGNHSAYFLRYCPGTTAIVAIEPARDLMPALQANLRLHGTVRGVPTFCVNAAVGLGGRWATVRDDGGANTGGRHAVPATGAPWAVPVVTIDEIVDQTRAMGAPNDRVAYIKLDIEGAEADAIRGAQATIAGHKPAISAETAWDLSDAGEKVDGSVTARRDEISALLRRMSGNAYREPELMPTATPSWLWLPS